MTIFSDDVLMLNAAEMEEWYEHELIMRAETELRVRAAGGTHAAVQAPGFPNTSLIPWVGAIPSQFNMVVGQNFGTTTLPGVVSWTTSANLSLTTGQVGPDGTTTATKLVQQTGGGNTHFLQFNQNTCSFGAATQFDIPFRIQVIAKKMEMTRIVIQQTNAFTGDQVSVGADLAGGNIGYDNQATNWVINSATMARPLLHSGLPGITDWWLITLDYTEAGPNTSSVNSQTNIFLDFGSGTAPRNINQFAGDGVSGVVLWYVVFLPRAAYLFSGESFRDDFTSLATIDVSDSRKPGFNWYVHNRWPLSAGGTFWTTGTATPPANISQTSPTVVRVAAPDPTPAFTFTSVAADPVTGQPTVLGNTFKAPCIIESSYAYDPSVLAGFVLDTGSFPAFWSIALNLLQGVSLAAEIDFADQVTSANQYPFNVLGTQAGVSHTYLNQTAGFNSSSPTDFRQIGCMFFAPNASTNNHGFAMGFWKQVSNTQTINSQFLQGSLSERWDGTSTLATQPFMINTTAGLGTISYDGTHFVPFSIPVFYDWIRVIT